MVEGELKPQMASDDEGGVGGWGYCRRQESVRKIEGWERGKVKRRVSEVGGRDC